MPAPMPVPVPYRVKLVGDVRVVFAGRVGVAHVGTGPAGRAGIGRGLRDEGGGHRGPDGQVGERGGAGVGGGPRVDGEPLEGGGRHVDVDGGPGDEGVVDPVGGHTGTEEVPHPLHHRCTGAAPPGTAGSARWRCPRRPSGTRRRSGQRVALGLVEVVGVLEGPVEGGVGVGRLADHHPGLGLDVLEGLRRDLGRWTGESPVTGVERNRNWSEVPWMAAPRGGDGEGPVGGRLGPGDARVADVLTGDRTGRPAPRVRGWSGSWGRPAGGHRSAVEAEGVHRPVEVADVELAAGHRHGPVGGRRAAGRSRGAGRWRR